MSHNNKFKKSFDKHKPKTFHSSFDKHKHALKERSKSWGDKKFKPRPFVRSAPPPEPEESQPWQHVKNDILDDEQEQRSSDRFNMGSQQAKNIMKEREKNHRRNVIEAKRNEATTWEKFTDDDQQQGKKKYIPKPKLNVTAKDQKQLSTWERNFVRQKLTRVANRKYQSEDMDSMIKDMKKNKYVNIRKEAPINQNNKFRNGPSY